MIDQIVKLVFEKAKKETPNTSKTGLATHISKKIEEDHPDRIISYKTLTRYYDKYLRNKDGVIDEPQPEIIEYLCQYLGYEGYEDFREKYNRVQPESGGESKGPTLPIKTIILTIALIIVIGLIYFGIDWQQGNIEKSEKNCMTWTGDHYELAICPKNHDPKIIPIDRKLLKEFRKIEVDTNYVFFDDEGNALVWYYKSGSEIDYFNMSGIHPTNQKKLKRVSQTIIRKYVFGEE
ncbi:hypothetical protein [Aquimarina celericrescens]|uniref:KTSC domain-containing protein n=1 Tax=Aquimarina celericrescens TaxID=1964542 RepID=A0ABW5B0I7_9FLAO|nr:hypothetical protein [Aquimarina celericrescens]